MRGQWWMTIKKEMIHPTPLKIAQQALQPMLHPVNVHVMTESCLAIDAGDARLVGIDLPRMEIKDR